jgi:hypothetical protein
MSAAAAGPSAVRPKAVRQPQRLLATPVTRSEIEVPRVKVPM